MYDRSLDAGMGEDGDFMGAAGLWRGHQPMAMPWLLGQQQEEKQQKAVDLPLNSFMLGESQCRALMKLLSLSGVLNLRTLIETLQGRRKKALRGRQGATILADLWRWRTLFCCWWCGGCASGENRVSLRWISKPFPIPRLIGIHKV